MSNQQIPTWQERMPAPYPQKYCTMNCGAYKDDKRSRAQRMDECGDCVTVAVHGDPIAARDAEIADLRAALSQQVQDGWQLVPIEPTREMMDDAFDNISLSDAHTTYGVTEHVWAYMLEHAPAAPKGSSHE